MIKLEDIKKIRNNETKEDNKELTTTPTEKRARNNFHGDCDHPNTMEDSTATLLWVASLALGIIFDARLIIWIICTVVWFKFITRHHK